MKYRLKKDLPFAKAGAIIYDSMGNYMENYDNRIDCFVTCSIVDKERDFSIYQYRGSLLFIGLKPNLISEGWIEEVKPREFRITLVNGEPAHYTTPPIEHFDKLEHIKVREVLDD